MTPKTLYYCPYPSCNQTSTRRWNMDVHIKRKHDDRGPAFTRGTDGRFVSNTKDLAVDHRSIYDRRHEAYFQDTHFDPDLFRKKEVEQERAIDRKVNELMRKAVEFLDLSKRLSSAQVPPSSL